MYVPKPLWVTCFISFWLISTSMENVHAQETQQGEITFNIVSKEMLPTVDTQAEKIIIKKKKEILTGSLFVDKGQRILSVQNRADIILPHNLPALVSSDGSTILQFGDTKDLSHPVQTDMYWLNAKGKQLGELIGYYRADTVVALSDDGFTAVAGSRTKDPKTKVLSLFTPKGKRLWEYVLAADRNITSEPVVTADGERVAVVTTDKKSSLQNHRILILNKKGKTLNSITTDDIVQKIVLPGNGKALFIQGKKRHGMIELKTGNMLWSKIGHIRLVGPRAAAMSPDSDALFLMTADWHGSRQATYQWRLIVLDANNGQRLGTWELPKTMPGTRADVFGRITDDRINILFGAEQLSISWSR